MMRSHSRAGGRMRSALRAIGLALVAVGVLPATASAHTLTGRYESPLPLAAYLGGAAVAVGLSFAIVILRSRAGEPAEPRHGHPVAVSESRRIAVPAPVRLAFRALGLVAWLWIVIQGMVAGTSSDADVGSLFLWTYGWVAIPLLSAFVAPIWEWLDPFATLHDIGAAVVRRLGRSSWRMGSYPAALSKWPAVATLVIFVWLELVYSSARGGRVLAIALVLYTAWTLAMMAQFGRDAWRRHGEAFTVWFGILNRLAPLGPADERARAVVRRPFGAGLLTAQWLRSELVLVAVGTGSILYDGLSQTQPWFDLVGVPSLAAATVQLLLLLAVVAALVVGVARIVGIRAMAAGLVPIALGYLVAHYFTALAFDGQRIVAVISDPFNVGSNLFGTATFEPNETYLSFGIVWAVEVIAVVGGHIYGAIKGHEAAVTDPAAAAPEAASAARRGAAARGAKARSGARTAAASTAPAPQPATTGIWSGVRARQVPLAILMVALTTLTLWSLGQNLVQTPGEVAAAIAAAARA